MQLITEKELNQRFGDFESLDSINKNHHLFHFTNGTMLYSYGTRVACIDKYGQLYLTTSHDYSATTNKYVKRFTNLSADERRLAIANGTAILIKL